MRLNTESIHTIYPNDCFAVVFGSQIVSWCLPRLGSSSYFWKTGWELAAVNPAVAKLPRSGLRGCQAAGKPLWGPPHLHPLPFMAKAVPGPCISTGLVSSCPLQSHSVSKVNAGHSFCQAENLGVYVFWHQNNDKVITLRVGSGTTCLSTGVSAFCLEQCYATVTIFCR